MRPSSARLSARPSILHALAGVLLAISLVANVGMLLGFGAGLIAAVLVVVACCAGGP